MPLKMSSGMLTVLDMYGHPITIKHQGQSVYRTKLGSLVTLLTYVLIVINSVDLYSDFTSMSS